MDKTPLEITAHPPERRRRQMVVAPCGCCCCCCCCLHTVGSLVGAGVASAVRTGLSRYSPAYREEDYYAQTPALDRLESEHAAVRLYWRLLFAALIVAGLVALPLFVRGGDVGSSLLVGVVVVLVFLPLGQLGVSVLAAIVIGFSPPSWFADKGAALGRIGKITVAMIGGGLLGIAVMAVLGFGMGLFR